MNVHCIRMRLGCEKCSLKPPDVESNVILFPRANIKGSRERIMGSTPEFRQSFVRRLVQACDESAHIPPPHKGRQNYIAEKIGVVAEAVSKWFNGVAMPRPDKLERLAELLQVDQSWLAFGISPEMTRTERKAHVREIDGAVHLVMGMMMLAGANCGMPGKNDQRAAYVDFYSTMRGTVYPIHVAMAREVSRDSFEIALPKEFSDVRCIAVVPAGSGKFHFLDLPMALVNEHKSRKSGGFQLVIHRTEPSRYQTGTDVWPRIRSFGEMS